MSPEIQLDSESKRSKNDVAYSSFRIKKMEIEEISKSKKRNCPFIYNQKDNYNNTNLHYNDLLNSDDNLIRHNDKGISKKRYMNNKTNSDCNQKSNKSLNKENKINQL